MFFDGPIAVTRDATYVGRGTIYASETVTFRNDVRLCAVAACDETWNPQNDLLVLVAGSTATQYGFVISNNAVYQGGGYAANDYYLAQNAQNWGPMIARQLFFFQNSRQNIPLQVLPPGAPGLVLAEVAESWREYSSF